MDFSIFFPITGILCFVIAIIFFRKRKVPVTEIFIPIMTRFYNFNRIKEDLKPKGIFLIILGYLMFIIYLYIVFF